MSPPSTSDRKQLPLELVSRILKLAWIGSSLRESRLDLYRALATAHPHLHAVVNEVATRNVVLDFGPGLKPDLELYRDILSPLNTSTSSNSSETRQQRIHVCIENCCYVDTDCKGQPKMGSSRMYMVVATLVEDCTSFTVNYNFVCEAAWSYDSPLLALAANGIPDLSFLSAYPSLTSLHIHHRLPHFPVRWIRLSIAVPRLSALVTLRLWEFPHCKCTPRLCPPGCLFTHFARMFPILCRLHIETPVSLRTVDVPHTLKTFTIDAPPVPYEYEGPVRGSLSRWGLGAALHEGFMRWDEGPEPREVVVRTFARDPEGWAEAVEACARYALRLRRSEYDV